MENQNYQNHRKYVPLFHFVLGLLVVVTLIGSIVNLFQSCGDHERLYSASLIMVISVCMLIFFWFVRAFPAKVQDRAIRAEENMRHYIMTGKQLDSRLKMSQIVALRFADDDEWLALMKRAIDENLSNDQIKKEIKKWKADHHRQ